MRLCLLCVLSSVTRSCATRDDSNKDNICTPTISSGINRPTPSRPSRIYPECRAYETRLAVKDSFSEQGPCEKVSFAYFGDSDGEVGPRIRRTTEGEASPLEKDSWSDRTGRMSNQTNETIRVGAEDAEYRSGSDTKEGERLLLRT